jgi:hypothetical protein
LRVTPVEGLSSIRDVPSSLSVDTECGDLLDPIRHLRTGATLHALRYAMNAPFVAALENPTPCRGERDRR